MACRRARVSLAHTAQTESELSVRKDDSVLLLTEEATWAYVFDTSQGVAGWIPCSSLELQKDCAPIQFCVPVSYHGSEEFVSVCPGKTVFECLSPFLEKRGISALAHHFFLSYAGTEIDLNMDASEILAEEITILSNSTEFSSVVPGMLPVSRRQAHRLLERFRHTEGWYLVRPSESHKGQFVISVTQQGDKPKHFKVLHTHDQETGQVSFYIASQKFASLPKLMLHYHSFPIACQDRQVLLIRPISQRSYEEFVLGSFSRESSTDTQPEPAVQLLRSPVQNTSAWRAAFSPPHQRLFYFNNETGESSFDCPTTSEEIQTISYEWRAIMHEQTRQIYYHNVRTGLTQWEQPSNFPGLPLLGDDALAQMAAADGDSENRPADDTEKPPPLPPKPAALGERPQKPFLPPRTPLSRKMDVNLQLPSPKPSPAKKTPVKRMPSAQVLASLPPPPPPMPQSPATPKPPPLPSQLGSSSLAQASGEPPSTPTFSSRASVSSTTSSLAEALQSVRLRAVSPPGSVSRRSTIAASDVNSGLFDQLMQKMQVRRSYLNDEEGGSDDDCEGDEWGIASP
eukprot:m.32082 g.32082  ORF g.32082 m.32082 type:complete len:569 (+) comp5455_c0_seq1:73-1779(+)